MTTQFDNTSRKLWGVNPSGIWTPINTDANGNLLTSLTGSDGTLPYVTGYIQNISDAVTNGGVQSTLAVVGPNPVAGSIPALGYYFAPPWLDARGFNSCVVWYEGLTSNVGVYANQVYDKNFSYGFGRGGAVSNMPSSLNTTAAPSGDASNIFWFQSPTGYVQLQTAENNPGTTAPAGVTITFTGIGFFMTR